RFLLISAYKLEERHRVRVAILTVVGFLSLGLFLFGQGRFSSQTLGATLLLCSPILLLAFLSMRLPGGIIFFLLSSLLIFLTSAFSKIGLLNLTLIPLTAVAVTCFLLWRKKEISERENHLNIEKMEGERNLLEAEHIKQRSLTEALRKRLLKYSMLREITESLSTSLDLEEILNLVVDSALYTIGKGERALLFLVEDKGENLSLKAVSQTKGLKKIKWKKGDHFDGWVLRQKQNLIVTDTEKDFRFRTREEGKERRIRSLISSPLLSRDGLVGILRLDSQEAETYIPDDLRLLDIIASLTAVAVENAKLYERTQELAIKDSLTELYVHQYLRDRLEEELKRALLQDYPLSLIMFDLDHFKDYNDRFGHIAGDIALKRLAKILKREAGEGNLAARYGGEEFVLLIPRAKKKEAVSLAEKIRKEVAGEEIFLRRRKTHITVSGGVASFPTDARGETQLIEKADEALYRAKAEGRNRVCT
ncbi:sensor domain-containing diguanylate cyclase, partial [bacterium]|nr:sensor domain-containing diguanylate cyclase [bacterium]MCK4325395.1 sensor domain-containing diguanylate cyclase [bacterium]